MAAISLPSRPRAPSPRTRPPNDEFVLFLQGVSFIRPCLFSIYVDMLSVLLYIDPNALPMARTEGSDPSNGHAHQASRRV